jgi:hypothetical protein
MAVVSKDIPLLLPYLARDELFQREKPYSSVFDVGDVPNAKPSNHIIELHPKTIRDGRPQHRDFKLHTNGFQIIRAPTGIDPDKALDKTFLARTYVPQMRAILRKQFPEYKSIRFIDYQVCHQRGPLQMPV